MARIYKEPIGNYDCAICGEQAEVMQAKNGFLYTKCGCGCDQRNGAKVQTDIFNATQWVLDPPDKPKNYIEEMTVTPLGEDEKTPAPLGEKQNSKNGLIATVLLGAVGALWFMLRGAK